MKNVLWLFVGSFCLFSAMPCGCNPGEGVPEDASMDGDDDGGGEKDADADGGPLCNAETCALGCCRAGVCEPLTNSTCGLRGVACDDCVSQGMVCDPIAGKCCATCEMFPVQKGDIVFWGREFVDKDHPDYLDQSLIKFFSAGAKAAGILTPKWGENPGTWDDTSAVTGRRTIWTSAEIVLEDGVLENPSGVELAVLRPTEVMRSKVDIEAMVERFLSYESIQPMLSSYPFVGIFLRWTKWAREGGIEWVIQPDLGAHWNEVYSFDVDTMENPVAMQGDPENLSTDLDFSDFWIRTMSPGSRVAWALIWGERVLGGDSVRKFYLDDIAAVAAVDAVTPGQLAWWLVENDMAHPPASEVSLNLSFRRVSALDWEGYAVGRAPFGTDMLVEIKGGLGEAEVEVRCIEDGPVVWGETVDLPLTLELEDICFYPVPGWFSAVVDVRRDGRAAAEGRITAAAVPEQISVQNGDVLMFASPVPTPWSSDYLTYAYLAFMSAAAGMSGVYDSFWGEDLSTWDDSSAILDHPAVWGHVEIAGSASTIYFEPDPLLDIIVLRPTHLMEASVDIPEAASRTISGLYNQPFVGVFFKWLAWARTNETWLSDELIAGWSMLYGVDFRAVMEVRDFQWSAGLGFQAHTDIDDVSFWHRDHNCSSLAAWQIIWGWYMLEGAAVRDVFLHDNEAVSAVDGVSPGQLASWLLEQGFVYVADP